MTDNPEYLVAYNDFRNEHPRLFENPPNSAYEILFDPDVQRSIGAGLTYRDPYIIVLRDAVRFRDGRVTGYVRILPNVAVSGAVVLPIHANRIALVRHFRHATRSWHWEVPRGFSQKGETSAMTGRREVEEELGAQVGAMRHLGRLHPDTGLSSAVVDLFVTYLDELGELEGNEGIDEIRLVTPDQFDDMVRGGEITDSFTITAVFNARLLAATAQGLAAAVAQPE
jgi:ADP-ribose pyrophosphatase